MNTTKPTNRGQISRRSWEDDVVARMRQVANSMSFSRIAQRTGVHPETVRRYITRGRPSAFFIASFCRAFNVSPNWVLFGIEDRSGNIGGVIEPKPGTAARATSLRAADPG